MLKPLVVIALALAVLSSTGCCWPMHGGRHRYYDGYSEASRPAPAGRPHADRADGRH